MPLKNSVFDVPDNYLLDNVVEVAIDDCLQKCMDLNLSVNTK